MERNVFLVEQLPGTWFCEDPEKDGDTIAIEVKKVLYHKKSSFQDIMVFESATYGKVLVLDNLLQLTERDEFIYHEMITHLPMFSHPSPKSVLVIGGGDGGVLREVTKHPSVEQIHICEIDEDVIKVSKEYLKQTAVGFDNSKVTVIIQDAMEYLKITKNKYDVIISDSSDPTGPAEALFQKSFIQLLHNALKDEGIICMQGQCVWYPHENDLIKKILKSFKDIFEVTTFATSWMPSFCMGQIGFILASKNKETNFENPMVLSKEDADSLKLKFYDSNVHKAALALPRFIKKGLDL